MSGPRPSRLVLVAGTGTEVGKTWVAARLLEAWRTAGLSVAARKPVQSFEPEAGPTDAEVLGAASAEDPDTVCAPARSYPVAMAPPMAADALGRPALSVRALVDGIVWPDPPVAVGVVETAGGVRSPQAHDGDVLDVVAAIAPDVVVVVGDAGLGTINAVRLTIDALAGACRRQPRPAEIVVVLNRSDVTDELHVRNRTWLAERAGIDAVEASAPGIAALAARLAGGARRAPGR